MIQDLTFTIKATYNFQFYLKQNHKRRAHLLFLSRYVIFDLTLTADLYLSQWSFSSKILRIYALQRDKKCLDEKTFSYTLENTWKKWLSTQFHNKL